MSVASLNETRESCDNQVHCESIANAIDGVFRHIGGTSLNWTLRSVSYLAESVEKKESAETLAQFEQAANLSSEQRCQHCPVSLTNFATWYDTNMNV